MCGNAGNVRMHELSAQRKERSLAELGFSGELAHGASMWLLAASCAILAMVVAGAVWRERITTKYWVLATFIIAGACNIANFYAGPISLAAAVLVWLLASHRNPPVQPIRKLQMNEMPGVDGFTFFRFGERLPNWFPELMRSEKDESGLVWEGFGMGVSRTTGKVEAIAVWLYGTNGGVGHYSYRVRENTFRGSYGEGHFNLMPYAAGSGRWERSVLSCAGQMVSRDVLTLTRPLDVTYDAKSGAVSMYDPDSRRDVYFNEGRSSPLDDLFAFGPVREGSPESRQRGGVPD